MKTKLLFLFFGILSNPLSLQAQIEKEMTFPLMIFRLGGKPLEEKQSNSNQEPITERTTQARRAAEGVAVQESQEAEVATDSTIDYPSTEELFSTASAFYAIALDKDQQISNGKGELTLNETQDLKLTWQVVLKAHENASQQEEYLSSLSPELIQAFNQKKEFAQQRFNFWSEKEINTRRSLTYANWKRDQDAKRAAIISPPETTRIRYLRPLTLADLATSEADLKKLRKLAQKIKEKRKPRLEATAKLSQEYEAMTAQERARDQKWRDLYNRISKNIVNLMTSENPLIDWTELHKAKQSFKKSYNRARQAMSQFQLTMHYDNRDVAEPHFSNFETIRNLANTCQQELEVHFENIVDAYNLLLEHTRIQHTSLQGDIEQVTGLWNQAAAQASSAEHLWKLEAGYAEIVRLNKILDHANTSTENRYDLGHVSSREAEFLCNLFVGPNATTEKTNAGGRRLVSADRSKQSRFTEFKSRNEFTGLFGCRMANLERRLANGSWSNGHLTVSDIISLVPKDHSDDHYVLSSEDESN